MGSKYIVAALAIALLSSCSSRAKNNGSPEVFTSLSCDELRTRAKVISAGVPAPTAGEEQLTDAEKVFTKVGRTIFWLEIKLLEGDDPSPSDVARLKREAAAIERASDIKNCGIKFG